MTRFNSGLAFALIVAGTAVGSSAAKANLIAQYTLGENNLTSAPVDTTGNHDFANSQNSSLITVDTSTFAPAGGSTASLLFSPASGYYSVANVGGAYPLTDNFKVDLWAKASSTTIDDNRFISTDGAGGTPASLQIGITSGHYTADVASGSDTGTVFSTGPAITTAWTELTLIRSSGVTTFYVNGIPQLGTTSTAVQVSTGMHLGVTPGGGSSFSGNLDQVTISTTTPEPGSFVLFGLGVAGLALAGRRRRRHG